MFNLNGKKELLPKVADFYLGKSIFLTGAAGFVGTVLLEIILRCCPGIKCIYILLRPKKTIEPKARKEKIFNKKIFQRLKDENPEVLKKVCVIAGDISLPNLGMNNQEMQLLIEEVSLVFHCASVTHFKKSLKFVLTSNVLSLNTIIELCRKMKNLEALIYTSSAYCNFNHVNVTLKEEVYRLPFRAEKFLEALKNETDEKLQELFTHCKPDWPNFYSFSKCLAENMILDTASDLPIAIIRPSITLSTWKHPIPGYFEENSVAAACVIGVGRGFLKVLYGNPKCKFNIVPADIVANSHVIAACKMGVNRCGSPLIVHCTATEKCVNAFSEFCEIIIQVARKFPHPQSFSQLSSCIIVPYRCLYYIAAAFFHYLPAIFFDGILKIVGQKPRIYSLYRFFDKTITSGNVLLFYSNDFERNNLDYLDKLIHPEDRKNLSLDFSEATFLELSLKMPVGAQFYDWKTDDKSPSKRQKIIYWNHIIISCIQGVFLILFTILIYLIISWYL